MRGQGLAKVACLVYGSGVARSRLPDILSPKVRIYSKPYSCIRKYELIVPPR